MSIRAVSIAYPCATCQAGTRRNAGFFNPVGTLTKTCSTRIGGLEIAALGSRRA
jgi:hypothetical protein